MKQPYENHSYNPAYNEESTIGDVIKATSPFVDDILVISDGSIDSTTDTDRTVGATVTTTS